MNVDDYLEQKPAPFAVFDDLEERASDARFMLPTDDGSWEPMTWREFAEQIRHFGQFLLDAGVESGDRVAIFAPNSVEWISAALATQAVGGVMVPIYPSSSADDAAYVVEHSGAKIVFADTDEIFGRIFGRWSAYDEVERIGALSSEVQPLSALRAASDTSGVVPDSADVDRRVASLSEIIEKGRTRNAADPSRFDDALHSVDLDDPGLMLYTSGTTGKPKGVPLTHRNVSANGTDWIECNGPVLQEGAVDLLWLPLSHVFGFGEACLGNTLGFTTYMSDPGSVLGQLPEVKPSVFMSVPRYFEKLAEAAKDEAESEDEISEKLREVTGGNLSFCLSGGAGLSREVKELFYDAGMLIIEGYGLTEASPTLTLNRPDDFDFDTVGKPLPSVELKIADDGEILAKGENIFGGYHENPQATEEAFTDDGWLKTGDLGEFTDDGFLKIIGRKKEILVTAGGKNVSPAKIEQDYDDDPYVEYFVVYGDGKKYLVAGIWPNWEAVEDELGEDPSDDELQRFFEPRVQKNNEGLAKCETIKKFEVFDEPLTDDNGLLTPKLNVRRNAVYDRFEQEFEALYNGGA